MTIRRLTPFLLAALALTLAACGGDDPAAPTPAPEGPILLGSRPAHGQPGVETNEPIVLSFDRAIDAATLQDALTLSRGFVVGVTWLTDRTAYVAHTDWDEGVEVVLTVGTSVLDAEGRSLPEAETIRFMTLTDDVRLYGHAPDDGATGVVRNAPVRVTFTRWMDETTLATGIVVSSPGKADHPFTISEWGRQEYALAFDPPLPANAEITVTVGTGCEDDRGVALESAASFAYRTGPDAVQGSPRIVSFDPPSGAEIDVDTPFIRVVFDQPVDHRTVGFSLMDINFGVAVDLSWMPRYWSDDRRTYTRYFGDLPPGVRLTAGIDRFRDLYGNESAAPYLWEATVAGDPELMPIRDWLGLHYEGEWRVEGAVDDGGPLTEAIRFELGTDGRFDRLRGTHGTDEVEIVEHMEATETGLFMSGWTVDPEASAMRVDLTPAMKWLNHPPETTSWQEDVDWAFAADSGTIDWTVTVLPGSEDRSWSPDKSAGRGGLEAFPTVDKSLHILLNDCRTVVMDRIVVQPGSLGTTLTDTLVFCPGFGLVARSHLMEVPDIGQVRWESLDMAGILFTGPVGPAVP